MAASRRLRLGCRLAACLLVAAAGMTQAFGQTHEDPDKLSEQVVELYQLGKYAEALAVGLRALVLAERQYGSDHSQVGVLQNNVGELYRRVGGYGEAEPHLKRALAINEKLLGSEHPDLGVNLGNLASVYKTLARYEEAEALYKRALAIREKALGPDHPDVGAALNGLAELYLTQGRYSEAEPIFRRCVTLLEKGVGPDDPTLVTVLNNIASLYDYQGRYADAEPLYKRSLAIGESKLGADHLDVAQTLNNLGSMYLRQGRYGDGEAYYKRSLAIREKVLGPDHPVVAVGLDNLAAAYQHQDRYAEAEPLARRALGILEKVLGRNHPDTGTTVNNLAHLYQALGRYTEAERLFERSLAIIEKTVGPNHANFATTLYNLAHVYYRQDRWARAVEFFQRSADVSVRRANRNAGREPSGKTDNEVAQDIPLFSWLVRASHRLASAQPARQLDLERSAFKAAQWAQTSESASSLAQMAARQATGDTGLARLVRERQDLIGEWQLGDKALIAARSTASDGRDAAAEGTLIARLATIDTRVADIDGSLAKEFPQYANLVNPAPLGIPEVQALLRADEALVLLLDTSEKKPTPEESFVWVVTKTDARWVRSAMGTKALSERVDALRCGLDHTLWWQAERWPDGTEEQKRDKAAQLARRQRCTGLLDTMEPGSELVDGKHVQVLPFDLLRAHEVYKALLGPLEDMIAGKHLIIVPSGPLTRLPFNVLVTEPPQAASPTELLDYRQAAWLGTRQPVSVLPSVASLEALRRFARTSQARRPYLGVGNPLLDGPQDVEKWRNHYRARAQAAREKQCSDLPIAEMRMASTEPRSAGQFRALFRGKQADIESVRAWSPLPETGDEVCAVGRRLGVPESDVLIGSRATEAMLKDFSERGRLAEYAILHFATHGALAGQVQGSAEPGLLMTPPATGTTDPKALERDDGFLTAQEIAALKLDADWVVLSACNTAAGSGETAEALSGMARAFFYAGARALLVSHWEVGSAEAVKLITRTFAELKAKPSMGRAEAFRLSVRALIHEGIPAEAHPALWAPFVVIGEGSAPAREPTETSTTIDAPAAPQPSRPPPSARKKTPANGYSSRPDWRNEIWRQ